MLKNLCVLVIFAAYLALVGCGTKGPLYIPEQRYPQKNTQETPKAAPEATAPTKTY